MKHHAPDFFSDFPRVDQKYLLYYDGTITSIIVA